MVEEGQIVFGEHCKPHRLWCQRNLQGRRHWWPFEWPYYHTLEEPATLWIEGVQWSTRWTTCTRWTRLYRRKRKGSQRPHAPTEVGRIRVACGNPGVHQRLEGEALALDKGIARRSVVKNPGQSCEQGCHIERARVIRPDGRTVQTLWTPSIFEAMEIFQSNSRDISTLEPGQGRLRRSRDETSGRGHLRRGGDAAIFDLLPRAEKLLF